MTTILKNSILFVCFLIPQWLLAQESFEVNTRSDRWVQHPYFGYHFQELGRPSQILTNHGSELTASDAYTALSQKLLPVSDKVIPEASFWFIVYVDSLESSGVLLSFGMEQETSWEKIEIFDAQTLLSVAKGGKGSSLKDKTFKTNADVFRLKAGFSYLVHLKNQIPSEDKSLSGLNIYVFREKDYFDFLNYTFPESYFRAGGYLYDFNLIKRSVQVYCDSSGMATLPEVQAQWNQLSFSSYNLRPNPEATYWMRFTIDSSEKSREYLMGLNSGSFWNFDSAEVYVPGENDEYLSYSLGGKVAAQNKPFGVWHDVFPVQMEKGEQKTIYIRLKGFNKFFIPDFQVSHLNPSSFWKVTSWVKFIFGFFIGLILVQFLYYFIRYFLEKEPLHLYFSLFVLGVGLWISFFSTDLQFTPLPRFTEWNIPLASIGMSLAIIFIYAYQYTFLSLGQYRFPFKKVFWFLAIVNSMICFNYAVHFQSFASVYPLRSSYLQLIILSLLLNYVFVTAVGVYSILKKNVFGRAFTLAFVPLLLGIIIRFVLALVLILQGGTYNQFLLYLLIYGQYALMAGIAFALVMMAINTAVRFNTLKIEKIQAEKLREISEFKSRFYTNITHEFRTPLTVILGLSEAIDNEKEKKIITRNGKKLLKLVNQLLDMSKIESGSLPVHWVQGDFVKYVSYLVNTHLSLVEQKGIRLQLIKEVHEIFMDYDEDKTDKIISNLLSNAVKFTPEMGTVTCKIAMKNNRVRLEVIDTGSGISRQEAEHIFERFYQSEKQASADQEGSGIGLSLVKELTELLGGTINVESKPGQGACFILELPVHRYEKVGNETSFLPQEQSEESRKDPESALVPGKETILLVEDNQDVLALLIDLLPESYQKITAKDGKAGLQLAEEIIPDLIITDVMMPEMDGYQLCKALKSNPITDHIPVIMLTARSGRDSKISGLETGADAFLGKPFDKEELLLTIRNMVALQQKLQNKFKEDLNEKREAIPPFLKKVNSIIFEHLADEDFSAELLCDKLHLSRSQVYRKIKALSGLTIQLYIRSVRLAEARRKLKEEDKTVAQVAYECGWTDPSYFTRVFSEVYQDHPSDLKNT
ncbi:ATP-binding protein [Jiulongibacter sediminis]|uniref:histidine kinase n=1 Tax=Jiulongibacter sediminis TaxID=1605367 RepID=A0A0P7C475_9BACT|nr:ATP-binding protein [Jiulongibacter sediminis]KPM46675.1 hypothetical protein AFM12_17985 [Jiulongibacter sediminis]TBX21581.1 hypothetical protein TK44_17990 [Jiulongibacter sediminis]